MSTSLRRRPSLFPKPQKTKKRNNYYTMSWNILGDSFSKLLEHLESNQKRSQAVVDTLGAIAQAQQAYSVRLQGIAEQHEKKYLGSKREEDASGKSPNQGDKSLNCIFSSIKNESDAVNKAFSVMNFAIGALKTKQQMNSDDIRKLKIGYEDKTSDLKQKLKESKKLEENLNRAITEKRRITDLQEAKRKSSFFRSATKDRQTARAKELICREEYTKQVYIYNDNRKHIFGDFMPKLCEKAEEIYRKQINGIEDCRCKTNQTYQFSSEQNDIKYDPEIDLQRIFNSLKDAKGSSNFPELQLPEDPSSSESKSESGFYSGEPQNGTAVPTRRMTLDGVYAEPKKMSSSSMDFSFSPYEEIDSSHGASFLKRTASIKLYASQPPPPSPPTRPLRKFIALYNYNGQDAEGFEVENALEIHENDKLVEELSDGTDDGWIMVKDKHNDVGMVPISYLREVFDPV